MLASASSRSTARSTAFDTDPTALREIQQEWLSDRTFAERRFNLFDGSGSSERDNGNTLLNRQSVIDDLTINDLNVGSGQDWRVNFSQQAGLTSFQNKLNAFDVNDEGIVSIADALTLISELRKSGARSLVDKTFEQLGAYVDVDGDNTLTLGDALHVVQRLRHELLRLETTGEEVETADLLAASGDLLDLDRLAIIEELASMTQTEGSK